jgi:L-ascorbate metabolism protein UlaG (beta-lactamase superfamily)
MKVRVTLEECENLTDFIKIKNTPLNEVHIVWIGQAGFIFKFKNKVLIIDPYLSDYLSKKYKGKLFAHIRLIEIPINPEKITNIDYILCSHAHSDHMDPETISILSNKNPKVKIVIPAAEKKEALNRGAKLSQILLMNDGDILKLEEGLEIISIASAHEKLKINQKGEHHFLGFIFDFEGIRIYHSGDCVPYEGLTQKLSVMEIDIALLPINGRDEFRLKNNIAGNFFVEEVLDICKSAKIENLIVHHFGMFAYNTVREDVLENLRNLNSPQLQIIIPEINKIYKIKKI